METATHSSTGSIANNGHPKPVFTHNPDTSSLSDFQTPRYHGRFHLDAFQSPLDSLSSHRQQQHNTSSAAASLDSEAAFDSDVIISPRTIPMTFRPQHGTGRRKYGPETSSFPNASRHIKELHSPVLNIRRAPSRSGSLSKDMSELDLGDTLNEYQINWRGSSTSCGPSRIASLGGAAASPSLDAELLDEKSAERAVPSCDEDHCTRHHHRQRASSIVSIKCGRSDDDDDDDDDTDADQDDNNVDTTEPNLDRFQGGIEGSIQLEPMAASMLVPLIDRENEMSDLLSHPSNKNWVGLVEHAVGKDIYRTQCLQLWCETSRKDMSDIEWLRCSKKLLTKSHDNRLWRDFCGMVGWDEEEIPLEVERSSSGKRASSGSLRSTTSANMNAIKEEPEEE